MGTKHTPGGWARNIAPARKYNTIFAGRNTHVAHLATSGLSDEEIEANADLIAAAPDLLAALIYVQQAVEGGQDFGMSTINDAIRKATGGTL